MIRLIPLLLFASVVNGQPSGQGLLFPQSACNIRCENGGMCAYSYADPSVHSCICLMGVYEGDRCQYQIGEAPSTRPPKIAPTPDYELQRAQQREAEARAAEQARENAERRRQYELKIKEQEQREQQERLRIQMEADQRRIQEQARKDEVSRRENERRIAEENHRAEMERRQKERQDYDERRKLEEQKRLELLQRLKEQNRQRQQEEAQRRQQQEELQRRQKEEEERRRQYVAPVGGSDELSDDDMEPDNDEYEDHVEESSTVTVTNEKESEKFYDDDEDAHTDQDEYGEVFIGENTSEDPEAGNMKEDEKPKSNPLGVLGDIVEKAAEEAAAEHGVDLTKTEEEEQNEEPTKEESSSNPLGALGEIVEKAAEEAAAEHGIDLSKSAKDYDEHADDYFDHHPPMIVDSEEEDEIRRDRENPQGPKHIAEQEFGEEDEDGWMLVRKDAQESSSQTKSISLFVLVISTLFCFV